MRNCWPMVYELDVSCKTDRGKPCLRKYDGVKKVCSAYKHYKHHKSSILWTSVMLRACCKKKCIAPKFRSSNMSPIPAPQLTVHLERRVHLSVRDALPHGHVPRVVQLHVLDGLIKPGDRVKNLTCQLMRVARNTALPWAPFGWGRGGQLPTPGCPRLPNCPPLAFGFLMHKIGEN